MRFLRGDCVEVMAGLGASSVDAVVTDPPYELGFMGKTWDRSGVTYQVATWQAALRVLKPGGHLLAFGGTRTYHRLACAIEDAGFEIRDTICWLYGSGFPKSLNIGDGWGTALKPAHEPIVVARKPLAGTVAANVLAHGTGALNIDGSRIGVEGGVTRHTVSAGEHRDRWDGNQATGEETLHGGRWPANVVLDEEAAAMLDAQTGELPAGTNVAKGSDPTRQIGQKMHGGGAGGTGHLGYADTGGASRFFYCAKASRAERNAGLDGFQERASGHFEDDAYEWPRDGKGNPRSAPITQRNTHPTVKPVALMRWLTRLVTPPGGTILDPFLGSGSTGIAAALEDFEFVGIEREAEYLTIAQARIAYWKAQPRQLDMLGAA